MLDQETKKRINDLRDTLVGKVPDPKSQVEQIMIALIFKFMNDMDKESADLGGKASFFVDEFEKFSWSNMFDPRVSGDELVELYSDAIESMDDNPNIPQIFRDIFKNAFIPYKDPETLRLFLKQINEFEYSKDSEQLGDAFEHILNSLSSQGDAGQFRTPRHIIDFIVEIVDPKKDETVLDPASGTSGFLISAFKHIVNSNSEKSSGDLLSAAERKKIMKNINGYDISPDMVRIGLANMYLHGFPEPNVVEYDALTSEDRWNEYFDVILANPPFMTPKGGIRPHNKFGVKTNKAEELFVDYIVSHLKPKGRAGIIVPEGIIFKKNQSTKSLRQKIINEGLFAVVSLPSGVFKPYSGVKTSILFFDKSKATENIIFSEILSDGYELGDQRKPIERNDLPNVLELLTNHISTPLGFEVKRKEVLENEDLSLSINGYKSIEVISEFELRKLNEIVDIETGKREKGGAKNEGIPSLGGEHIDSNGKIQFLKEKYISENYFKVMKKGKLQDKDVLIVKDGDTGKIGMYRNEFKQAAVNEHVYILRSKNEILPSYLFRVLRSEKFQEVIKNETKGAVIPGINQSFAENLIPLPPLEKQQEIVDEIEQYQKVIDGAMQVVENYRPYFSKKNSEFYYLGDIANLTYGIGESAKDEGEFRYIRITDIDSRGKLIEEGKKFIDIDSESNYILNQGDVLVARTGATFGKCLYFDSEEPSVYAGYLIKVEPDQSKILNKFFWIFSQSNDYMNQKNLLVGGAGQPQFNANALKKLKIPKISIEEQEEIILKYEKENQVIKLNEILINEQYEKINEIISNLYN